MQKRDGVVSIVRVMGMFFIILCHLAAWLDFPSVVSQLFNVGVPLFLFISGYLYGNKTISHYWSWIKSRFFKICIPSYLFIAFIMVYFSVFLNQKISFSCIAMYLFNLQGLSSLNLERLKEVEHLWFLTPLMFCYLMTIGIKALEKKKVFSGRKVAAILIAASILVVLFGLMGIRIYYFSTYLFGYFTSRYLKKMSLKTFVIFTATMILFMGLRIGFKRIMDGTNFYDCVIVSFAHQVLAIWIFSVVYFANQVNSKLVSKIADSFLCGFIDKISYFVYITHYMFLEETFDIAKITNNLYLNLSLFFVLTFLSALLLQFICAKIMLLVNRHA